jgi:hypothetical protein
MNDPECVSLLADVLARQRSSLILYVVESSQAEVRDDLDRRVLAFYEDWYRVSLLHARELEGLLAAEDVIVEARSFPIEFSQFNYLSPAYLLSHVIQRMGDHLSYLSQAAQRLERWPLARSLLRDILASEGSYLEQARKLEADRSREPPKPPRIKGTSAARW